MELIKKNIHMDRIKCKADTQITMEDDRNIPDQKPDAEKLILDQGEIRIEEIKALRDHAVVKGKLLYSVLYMTGEKKEKLCRMEGELPFEEQVYMEGVDNADNISVQHTLEDLRIGLINSRKLSIQAIINIKLYALELYDEETVVDLVCEEPVETRKEQLQISELALQKKDIFRIREEVQIPSNLPNMYEILWEDIRMGRLETKPLDEKISIQGELQIFFLYETEEEESDVRWHETVLPFSGVLECHGSKENMTGDIICGIGHKEVDIKPDFDGEDRTVGMDIVLDLDIGLYEKTGTEIISDVYGVRKEVEAVKKDSCYSNIQKKGLEKIQLSERGKIKSGALPILQICRTCGEIKADEISLKQEKEDEIPSIVFEGTLEIEILYASGEENGISSHKESIPFQYKCELDEKYNNCRYKITPGIEQLQSIAIDGREFETKAVLAFQTIVFDCSNRNMITDVVVREQNAIAGKELPGIIVYIAGEGDTVWQLGKKYYVPVDQIKEINHLTGDRLKGGEKLLIVR